jgi:RNA polymerase sigma-70 factor (ECF subfamily)
MIQVFDEIYQRHAAEVYRYLRRLLETRVEAQDILQETFLKLHLQLASSREITNARAWLFQVATNLAHNLRRDEIRASQRESRYDYGPRVVDFHRQLEEQQSLRRALRQLPPQMRQVLLLSAEGFKHREIAEITGIAVGYVGVLVSRGRAAFKEYYHQQHERQRTEKNG